MNSDKMFAELSEKVNENRDEYESVIENTIIRKSMMTPDEFKKCIEKEVKQISADITPNPIDASISDYADLFKFFEDVPLCFQKPIKKPRESMRISRSSLCQKQKDSTIVNQMSPGVKLKVKEPELVKKSAKEIYLNYKKHIERIAVLKNEFNNLIERFAYYQKELKNLHKFGEQLNKLMPSLDISEDALTDEEKIKIKETLENMEHFIYIQQELDTFSDLQEDDNCPAKLQHLMDLVSDALQEIKYGN